MASKVDICNGALLKARASTILSLTDESDEARFCNQRFDNLVNTLLEGYDWTFAGARVQIAALTATPAFGWTYQHQLPTDCLHIRKEYNDYEFAREGDVILCDTTPIQLIYTKTITDVNKMSAIFREILRLYLAAEIALRFLGSTSLSMEIYKEATTIHQRAKTRDAQQNTRKSLSTSTWVTDR